VRGHTRLVLAAALVGAAAGAAAPAAADTRRCATTSVRVEAGASVLLRLDCRIGPRALVRGRGPRRVITARPSGGRLSGLDARRGTVRYTPRTGFSGRDTISFRIRGRRLVGRVVIHVRAPQAPAPQPSPQPAPPPVSDGLPPRLPPAPASVAFSQRNWQPATQDTCPRELHERFSVIGPDGKVYPGWHPPVVTDPATGRECTFGHEHGRDPRGSDLYDRVAAHLAAPGREAYSGIPFGSATEALDAWAGATRRTEDHVGYKVEYENDVALTTAEGSLGVTCDFLVRVHQGSHSPDALSNNVHELLYASRCSDGTEIISNVVGRFGDAGEYTRGCDPSTTIATTDNGYPDGPGARAIPDRTCVESGFLVPAGSITTVWATYELWSAESELTAGDRVLASYDTAFGVFDPSRYANGTGIARTYDLCQEVEPNGDRANTHLCDEDSYEGTHRDVYLRDTRVRNAGGPTRWWTDPYGGNASPDPFPGAICQLVAATDTPDRPRVQQRVFGRNRSHDAPGVHWPN
jgi:hypothetical protein